jgi:cellulose synthase/poly-beta-1,6-N-acetylglucosamine synthase-like glycosyltransferase
MQTDTLGQLSVAVFAFACLLQLVIAGCYFYLLWLYGRLRPDGLREEARLLSLPDGPEEALPHVVIQIPTFNEGGLVRTISEAVAGMDWPRDRLHVQFLDDSTDGSEQISAEVALSLRRRGIDARMIHRRDRRGFKAGALQAGLVRSSHEFFVVFDVDYLPPRDFLRRCLPPLLVDPALAFVQARFEYLNPAENQLTRAQAALLDHHLGIEQRTRSWAGHLVPCNGTCMVWRRAAIEAAGGWRGDTLAEDMDLSYRAWLAGWRGTYLGDVTAPGELPSVLKHWLQQQRRWKRGYNQVAWRYLPRILADRRLALRARWAVFLHLGFALSSPLSMIITWSAIAACLLEAVRAAPIVAAWLSMVAVGYAAAILSLRLGRRELRGTTIAFAPFLRDCLAAFGWRIYMDLVDGAVTVRESLTRTNRVFERTPKVGISRKPAATWASRGSPLA